MARALRNRIIQLKKQLNKEKHQVDSELAAVKNKETQLESAKLQITAQLERAHKYGVVHANENIFTCPACFINQDVLLNMRRTKALVAGVKRYKCPRCGEELNSDDQP